MLDLRTLVPGERITSPGFYRMTAAQYHADPCVVPSLSSSLAKILLDGTPRHAWTAHPRLNPEGVEESDPTRQKEIGTAAHKLLLGEGADVVVIDAEDYRSGAAKTARADAYKADRAPILKADYRTVENLVAAAREQMQASGVLESFEAGQSEAVMVWQDETGPWCRAMMDKVLIAGGAALITDLKTSGTSISPNGSALGWKVVDMGYEVSAAFYARGLAHLRSDLAGRITFRHVWCEVEPPHGLLVSQLDGCGNDIGNRKAAAAIGLWHKHLSAGLTREHWPLFPSGVHAVAYPNKAENDWLEREVSDPAIGTAISADPFLSAPGAPRPSTIDPVVLERGFA